MSDKKEVGSGTGDHLAAHFVGGGTDHRPPQACREESDEDDEEDDEEPARAGAPAQRDVVIVPTRSRGQIPPA
jgi:hypothetical protein